MTLAVGSPELAARIAVTVPVTVTCNPFSPSLTLISQSVTVRVEQAAGRAIARGTGSLFTSFPSPQLFPCDGTAHELPVTVLGENPAGPPFHGGKAIVELVNGWAEAGTPNPFGSGVHGAVRRQTRLGAGLCKSTCIEPGTRGETEHAVLPQPGRTARHVGERQAIGPPPLGAALMGTSG